MTVCLFFIGTLNSICAHNFIKLLLLHAYISVNNDDDDNLELPGYNIVHTDNPTNTKRGSVNSLPLKLIDIQFLNERINFEIRIGGKLCSFLCLYRSPSQT